jgi:RimJ/RimL family protein N-acetyltransferase
MQVSQKISVNNEKRDGSMKVLPESWETERLVIRDAMMEDVPQLRNVFNACSYVGEWDNSFYIETEEAFNKLVMKSLGLNHTAKDIFKMQSVFLHGGKDIIGYFHLFHDAPIPRRVWISMFVVHPHYQKNRYGSELAYGIWEQFKQMGEWAGGQSSIMRVTRFLPIIQWQPWYWNEN